MSRIRRGPALMAVAALLFAVMMALVKLARVELSAVEIIFWRGAASVPVAWLLARGQWRLVRPSLVALRSGLGFTAMLGFFTATQGMSLADLALLGRLQPMLVALAAPWLLGGRERSPGRLWGLMGLGLAGCALLVVPQLRSGPRQLGFVAWAGLGLVASAGAHLCLRALGRTDRPGAIVFWFQVAIVTLSGSWLAGNGLLAPPPLHLVPHLLGIGALATLGQVVMTRAYALDRAATVAAASYLGPVFSVGLDAVWFALWPSGWTVIGGVLVVGAGLLLVFSRSPAPRVDSPPAPR